MTEMTHLKERWALEPINLLCGSDGSLKEGIGSSGYCIVVPNREIPLVTGYAAEYHIRHNSSSTRQELLGQLVIIYWLHRLITAMGTPGWDLAVQLVTDSKASIDIMEQCDSLIGLKDGLRPEMDVALEIFLKLTDLAIKLEVIKVKSHIAVDEAPDENHWLVTTWQTNWPLI